MKKNVVISNYSISMSIIGIAVLSAAMFYSVRQGSHTSAIFVTTALVPLCLSALFYMPLSISADDHELTIRRSLRIKSIPMTDIQDVKLCPPTMGERRICGSGGWFGYWGWFRERDLGKYFAYYGKSSDCFLVTLSDGRKYMLGCKDAPAMVEYISERIR